MRSLLLIPLAALVSGLALLLGAVGLDFVGRGDIVDSVLRPCTPAPGDWFVEVDLLIHDYREPCARFYWKPGGEFYHLIRLNNYGLQDRDTTLEKPPGTYRILILGDSFPQGWQVVLEDNFPWLLEDALNTNPDRPVEVINLSVDTTGTDRQLLMYAVLGWRFQPDLVLLVMYAGNDIKDVYPAFEALAGNHGIQRPFFSLTDDGGLQLHNAPIYDADRFPDSPAWRWLAETTAATTPAEQPLPDTPAVISTDPYMLEYPVDLGIYLPEDEHWRRAWALSEALVLETRDVVTADGAEFGILIVPDRRAIHAAAWDETVSVFPFLRGINPQEPVNRIHSFVEDAGIPVLNLLYTMQGSVLAHPDEWLYFAGDGHFNENGHAVVAQRLLFWLREQGWIR